MFIRGNLSRKYTITLKLRLTITRWMIEICKGYEHDCHFTPSILTQLIKIIKLFSIFQLIALSDPVYLRGDVKKF